MIKLLFTILLVSANIPDVITEHYIIRHEQNGETLSIIMILKNQKKCKPEVKIVSSNEVHVETIYPGTIKLFGFTIYRFSKLECKMRYEEWLNGKKSIGVGQSENEERGSIQSNPYNGDHQHNTMTTSSSEPGTLFAVCD